MHHYPGGYTQNYAPPYPYNQGYPPYAYPAQAQGYTAPFHTTSASRQSSPTSSQASTSSARHLKRSRTEKMHTLPTLPQPIYKVAIAHRSLEPPVDPEYGDAERLATIGRMILPAVIVEVLSLKKPLIENLKEEVDKRLETENLAEWCTHCELHAHVYCIPSEREELHKPHPSCDILYTFVGAVHTAYGISGVRTWLGKLIDPTYDENDESALKRARLEPATNGFSASPPPPTSQPPPPPNAPPPIPSGPAAGAAALPHLNQTAAQRRVQIEWRMTSSGPSHNPQWTAECILNGIVKGTGVAQSKQAAKEQAARITVQMMNY